MSGIPKSTYKDLLDALKLAERVLERGLRGMDQNPLGVHDIVGSAILNAHDPKAYDGSIIPTDLRVVAEHLVRTYGQNTAMLEGAIAGAIDVERRKSSGKISDLIVALTGATHALRSYQYGNTSKDLAEGVANACDKAIEAAR